MKFTVKSVNISEQKGVAKQQVEQIELVENVGIKNDAHSGNWHRQISFLAKEAIEKMQQKLTDNGSDIVLKSGAFGENIVTMGIDWSHSKVGDKVQIGDVLLEVTQIGKECHSHCTIYYTAGECIMPTQGAFAKVLKGGIIRADDCGNYGI
jgi:MOSC domain-containing protein YiiM